MKKHLFLLILVIGPACCLLAQDYQVPEFVNEPMVLKSDGSLGKLEKTAGDTKSFSAEAYQPTGFGGSVDVEYNVFPGARSAVRLNTGARFIIKLTDAEVDPESVFYLTKVIIKKNTRIIYTRKSYGPTTAQLYVNLDFEKLSPGVYRITAKEMKPNTEYGFVLRNNNSGKALTFLFGTN